MSSVVFVILFFVVVLSISSSAVDCQNNESNATTTMVKREQASVVWLKLNDTISLECSLGGHHDLATNETQLNETTTTTTTTAAIPSTGGNYSLFLFKKNDLLLQLHASHLQVNLRSRNDEGLYECGFYEVNKFGALNYVFVQSWQIRLEEVKTTKRNLLKNYARKSKKSNRNDDDDDNDNDSDDNYDVDGDFYDSSELSDYDGDFAKKNVNLFTRNPILLGLMCVFMLVVLVSILALVSWMNKAATSRKEKKDYLICANADMSKPPGQKAIYEPSSASTTSTCVGTAAAVSKIPTATTDATFIQIN